MSEAIFAVVLLVLLPAYSMWARRGSNGKWHVLVPAAVALLATAAAAVLWPRGHHEGFGGLAALQMAIFSLGFGAVAVAAASAAISALLTLPFRGEPRDPGRARLGLWGRILPLLIVAGVLLVRRPTSFAHVEASWEEGLLALRGPAAWLLIAAAVAMLAALVAGWLGSSRDTNAMVVAGVLGLAGLGVLAWKETRATPAEVEAHLWRRGQCDYFRLERTYGIEEKAHVIDELCTGIDAQRRELQVRYERLTRTRAALDALPMIGY